MAPVLAATDPAVVNGTTLTLSYGEALDGSSRPLPSAFTVAGGDATRTVTRVQVSGSAVLLTLSPPAEHGETGIRVSYRPGTNPIQDLAGNDATGFTNRSVENTTLDMTPPVIEGTEISSDPGRDETYAEGDVIAVRVRFSETVKVDATNGAPTLALTVGNRSKSASYDTGSNGAVVVFVYPVAEGDSDSDGVSIRAGHISLNGGRIEDLSDNPAVLGYEALAAQGGHRVDGVRPRLQQAVVEEDDLELSYDEALDEDSTPVMGDFTVTVAGSEQTLTHVMVSGSAVTLTLDSAVMSGEMVTVSYRPGTNPIQDAAGNDAEALTDHAAITPGPIPPTGGGGGGSFTQPPSTPQPPTVSAATPDSLTVEWTEPEDGGSTITDYDVQYREGGSGGGFTNAQHEGTARIAMLTGLNPDTVYEVQVRASNDEGTSFWSESGEGRTSPPGTGYYFPHLAVGASWQTTITYINYSPQEVTCQTDFLSDDGTPLMVSFAGLGMDISRTDVLPPGGSVHQETNVELRAPLAPGWARATCSGPVKASLLFRRRNSEGLPVGEAAVNAAAVPATRFVTFAEQGEGQFGTGVAYANPSATAAMITFTARDAAGQTLASVDRTLLPNGHDAQNMAPLFDLTSFTGSLEVTSTEPIVSLSLNFEVDPVFSSLPPGELDAAAQGSTTYYFPHLAVGASWQTTITYINYSPEEVSCQTDFLSDHGSPLMVSFAGLGTVVSRTDVLQPGGSVHQETNVELSAPLAPGWARATCSGPVKASLLFRRRNSEGLPVGEAAVNAAAVPATRFVTFAEQGEGQFGTGVAYANPSATAALVTFTAKDAAGQVLASVDRTLLPRGHDAQNMMALFGLISFTGSLEVTSTEPILSLSLNFEADPVFSSLPPGEVDLSVIPATGQELRR